MFPFIFKLLPIYYKHGMEEDKGNFVAAGLMSPKRSVTLSTRGGGACEINAPRGLLASRGHFLSCSGCVDFDLVAFNGYLYHLYQRCIFFINSYFFE